MSCVYAEIRKDMYLPSGGYGSDGKGEVFNAPAKLDPAAKHVVSPVFRDNTLVIQCGELPPTEHSCK